MLICNTRFYLMLTWTSTTDQMRQSNSRNSDKHRHQSHSQMCLRSLMAITSSSVLSRGNLLFDWNQVIYPWPKTNNKIRVIKLYKLMLSFPGINCDLLVFLQFIVFKVLKLHVYMYIYIHITVKMVHAILYGIPNHRNVIEWYSYGKNVLFCSPTGSEISLTFEIAPYVMSLMRDKIALPSACCIVFPPLVSLMKTQRKGCFSKDYRACT